MIEFRCPCCGTVLRSEEGDRVICVCCGADLSAGGPLQPETQHLQQPDMPPFGSPVPQQQPYAEQYPQQPYAQQYPQQPYAQQYPQQPYAQQYPQQPYAQQYPQQQPFAQQYMPRSQELPRQYTDEQLNAAKKRRDSWRVMNILLYLIQVVLIAAGVYLDDIGHDIGNFMIVGWMLSTPIFAIASAASRPDAAYLEKPPAIRSRFLQGLIQFLIGCTSLITGAMLWAILSDIL